MRPIHRALSVLQVVGVAGSLLLPASGVTAAPMESIRLSLGVGAILDDNLLELSDGQIVAFEAGANPDRYSIESVDDLEFEPTAALTYESERGRGAGRTLRLRWTGSFHGRNETVDRGAGSVLWQEAFGKGRSLTLNVYRLPNFYVRQLFDEDIPSGTGATRYRRASFGLTLASIAWKQRVSPRTIVSVAYQLEHRAYNDGFLERDSDTHEPGAGLDWTQRGGRLGFGASFAYRSSGARAEDGDDLATATPDDPDVGYRGVVLGAEGRVQLAQGRSGKLSADVAYEFRTRGYTSDRPADRSHYDRQDRLHDATMGVRWNPRGPFSLRAFYQHENNRASFGAPNPPATDPASYSENRIGAAITYGTTLWKR